MCDEALIRGTMKYFQKTTKLCKQSLLKRRFLVFHHYLKAKKSLTNSKKKIGFFNTFFATKCSTTHNKTTIPVDSKSPND